MDSSLLMRELLKNSTRKFNKRPFKKYNSKEIILEKFNCPIIIKKWKNYNPKRWWSSIEF